MAPLLMKKITKDVDSAVQEFCKTMADKYGICAEEAFTQWKASQQKATAAAGPKKRSPFVTFSMSIRATILEENPGFSFGDVSRETGRRWKLLSDEEKKAFTPAPVVMDAAEEQENEDNTEAPATPPPTTTTTTEAPPAPKKKKRGPKKNKTTVAEDASSADNEEEEEN
uniref:HMG box domain-containing protein n=1 Tax=viral metagenome TaxID=1070528 RepID=A0A6C0K3D8_9ZZZZ